MKPALIIAALSMMAAPAAAKLIQVGPADSYTKIESAVAGDVVEIAPGTYKYRVMLKNKGTAAKPITIRAKDPKNRPIWDLKGKAVKDWPGSYTAGDRGRGCWQIKGDHHVISGIIFRNCQDGSSAGVRTVNSGPVTLRDCLFEGNTNGITGSAEGFVVEFCEFKNNGKLVTSGSPTHNIYIYGGTFTLRYSYVHDPVEGQNFHVRARDAVIEYNWIARSASYPGDVMSCNTLCGGTGSAAITQKMTLRGNVIIQGQTKNLSQVIALYNDEGQSYDNTGKAAKMELTLLHNTVIGTPVSGSKTQRLVNMRNDGIATTVTLSNNVIYQVKELAVPHTASLKNWSVTGKNNWVSTGTTVTHVTGTIKGAGPGFVNASGKNYRLTSGSACRGKAAAVSGLPTKEYYLDEKTKLQYRPRASAKDIGAFEFGTASSPVGPYGKPPVTPDAGPPVDTGIKKDVAANKDSSPGTDGPSSGDGSSSADGSSSSPDAPGAGDGPAADGSSGRGDDGGCSCEVGQSPVPTWPALLILALALSRRKRIR